MTHDHKNITLGAKVRCRVTGFTGIVTSITDYLNGCTRCMVEPGVDKDGKMMEDAHFDVQQLAVEVSDPTGLAAGVAAIEAASTGGPPRSEAPRY